MQVTIKIYKDQWESKTRCWRARICFPDGDTMDSGFYNSQKAIKKEFYQPECKFIRAKEMDRLQ